MSQNENIFLKNINKYKFIAHRLGFLMEGYANKFITSDNPKYLKPLKLNGTAL